ncbi:unnamed protein product [Urochloa decumbens]|uniref:DUF295 domain-containing protein n=1 Tax=Urochloa decumbens TaxID=240449 RepID=A0ABC9FWL9_9POAL
MAQAWQPSSWSEIPRDLAGMVLRLLPAYADRARFAAVCPQWRAAARQLPLPPPLPLLALPDGTFYSLPYGKPFRFPGFGCVGYKGAAFGSWLVFPWDKGCFVVDPFTRATMTLPALSSVRLRPPNAADKFVKYQDHVTPNGKHYVTWLDIRDSKDVPTLHKLMVCSPNLVAAFVGTGHINQILMCQPGASSWSVRAYDPCDPFEDMVFYKGKLYTLAYDENLLVVNISQDPSTGDPQVSRIGQVIKGDPDPLFDAWLPDDTTGRKKLYLVESRGALLMVRRKVCCRIEDDTIVAGRISEFEVLEADFEHSRWVNVTTLGDDQMLFLGRSCSRAMSASQYRMTSDQIFFLDDVTENAAQYSFDDENTSVNIYDMTDGEVSSPFPMVWKHEMIHATWLFPQD